MPNHYEVLGVEENADDSEIKKAYRSLSFKHHPDRCQDENSGEIMQQLNAAYEVLRDPTKRQQYDAELQGAQGFGGMGGMQGFPPGFPPGFGMPGMGANLFEMLFSQMGSGMQGMPGMGGGINIEIVHNGNGATFIRRHIGKPETITKHTTITLEQSYTGFIAPIEIERWTMRKEDGLRISEIETIQVQIPAGIDNGETILLEGVGNRIEGSHNGDIKIVVAIDKHAIFIRNGQDLLFKKSLTLKEALCGTQFQFEHLNGKNLTLTVANAIVFPGGKKIFQNLGMPKKDGTSGNLTIEFDVQFPATLTPTQKEQLSAILP
jgi:DnaJ family protein B protein 4